MIIKEQVQFIIEADTPHGSFRDALYIPVDERDSLSDEDIQALAQDRVNSYVEALNNPVPDPDPTPEMIQNDIDALQVQQDQLQKVLDKLTTD